MVYADKQKAITRKCMASDNRDYWIIGGEGQRLRPGNWPERIAATFMQLDDFSRQRKIVSQCVSTIVHNERHCLKVRKAFQQGCLEGWRYILEFAESNGLSVIDNHGQPWSEPLPDSDHHNPLLERAAGKI